MSEIEKIPKEGSDINRKLGFDRFENKKRKEKWKSRGVAGGK